MSASEESVAEREANQLKEDLEKSLKYLALLDSSGETSVKEIIGKTKLAIKIHELRAFKILQQEGEERENKASEDFYRLFRELTEEKEFENISENTYLNILQAPAFMGERWAHYFKAIKPEKSEKKADSSHAAELPNPKRQKTNISLSGPSMGAGLGSHSTLFVSDVVPPKAEEEDEQSAAPTNTDVAEGSKKRKR